MLKYIEIDGKRSLLVQGGLNIYAPPRNATTHSSLTMQWDSPLCIPCLAASLSHNEWCGLSGAGAAVSGSRTHSSSGLRPASPRVLRLSYGSVLSVRTFSFVHGRSFVVFVISPLLAFNGAANQRHLINSAVRSTVSARSPPPKESQTKSTLSSPPVPPACRPHSFQKL